jgi:hypothetical protein
MAALDTSIQFGAVHANDNMAPKTQTGNVVVLPHPATQAPTPSVTHPAPGSIVAWIVLELSHFFKHAA